MAVFILTTPTLPSPIKGEGTKGRGDSFVEEVVLVAGWWE
jgi:hypothetical protein